MFGQPLANRFALDSEERIDRFFPSDRRRERRFVCCAPRFAPRAIVANRIVVGFDAFGKSQVFQGIFVGATDCGVIRQGFEAFERREKLLGRAFEEATAPRGKEGVAAKEPSVAILGDVPAGVPRHRDHGECDRQIARRIDDFVSV